MNAPDYPELIRRLLKQMEADAVEFDLVARVAKKLARLHLAEAAGLEQAELRAVAAEAKDLISKFEDKSERRMAAVQEALRAIGDG